MFLSLYLKDMNNLAIHSLGLLVIACIYFLNVANASKESQINVSAQQEIWNSLNMLQLDGKEAEHAHLDEDPVDAPETSAVEPAVGDDATPSETAATTTTTNNAVTPDAATDGETTDGATATDGTSTEAEAAIPIAKETVATDAATSAETAVVASSKPVVESKDDSVAEEEVYKVTPEAKGGMIMEPAPGMNDPAVHLRARDNFMGDVSFTTDFIGSHSFKEDIAGLLGEVDQSENQIKGLKLRIVEKENFIDSLIKREDILQADLNTDKTSVENFSSHIKAIKARIERLKKQKQLRLLEAQFHEYAAAASKLRDQADDLSTVKNALFSKMHFLNDVIKPLQVAENTNMRMSINADSEGALKPADLFPTTTPAPTTPAPAAEE